MIDIVRSCGYTNARTVGGIGTRAETIPPANMFAIRTPPLVLQQTTLAQLQKYVTDAENSGGGLVPFVIHRVCNGCGSDTITEANLRAFLDWLGPRSANGTVVRTMAQALGAPPPPPPPPAPGIASLAPSSATAGGPSFMLRVNGSGFTTASTVRWNGANRITTYSSPVRLDASIAAADIAAAGSFAVTVADPNGNSNAAAFTVAAASAPPPPPPAPPSISGLSPSSATAGSAAFTLRVDGANFTADAGVRWNGATRATTFVSAARLDAAIPASDLSGPGTASITVVSTAGTSNAASFTVSPPPVQTPAAPSISALSPSSATAGSPAFTLRVDGANFTADAAVRWNGANRATTFVSAARLDAAIPAGDVAAPGTASVTVISTGGLRTRRPSR
ncbi:MAG: IPT/TIG domain-containing protein [Elusimicrobiota bacterium]|nr:MAG: IPT/TIG domain-containing protein [Elusimicrobiota bacterium]